MRIHFFQTDSITHLNGYWIFLERIAQAARTDGEFFKQKAAAVQMACQSVHTANEQLMNGYPFKNS